MDSVALKRFGAGIQKLISGIDLSRDETCAMFSEVLGNRQPDLQQGAFLAALVSKGETAAEIAGAWQAIDTLDTVHVTCSGPVVDNSGTGMDQLKTFNVSSAAAIVAAACGVRMARHGARALTSCCGTVDILEAMGVDVECEAERVRVSIEKTGIGLFNGMSSQIHPAALGRILSQIRFGSTLNIAASLANPARPCRGVRGVYLESQLERVAGVMREIGYDRAMVVHGYDRASGQGMDEISVCGETAVLEYAGDGEMVKWRMVPEDAGVREWPFREIAAHKERGLEVLRFARVMSGREQAACEDFTVLNAAAILKVGGICETLSDGVTHARQCIRSGAALQKLSDWVGVQSRQPAEGLACLGRVLKQLDHPIPSAV